MKEESTVVRVCERVRLQAEIETVGELAYVSHAGFSVAWVFSLLRVLASCS